MGAVHLPDELERVIQQQIAEGRATTPAAFLEEAVLHLVEATHAEEAEIRHIAEAGIADIKAGRTTTIATPLDAQRLHESLMARVQARLAAEP
jgi:predicted transcriptional regulator